MSGDRDAGMRKIVNYSVKIIKRIDWLIHDFSANITAMKLRLNLRTALMCGTLLLATQMQSQAQILLTYWNFNNDTPAYNSGTLGSLNTTAAAFGETYVQSSNSVPGTLRSNTANSTVFNGSNVYIDFSNFSTIVGTGTTAPSINGKAGSTTYTTQGTTGGPSGYGTFSDSTVNQVSGDSTTGNSLILLNNATNGAGSGLNNKYLTFDLSSVGYNTLSLTYAVRVSSGIAASDVWTYSTDGVNFFTLTTITPPSTATFTAETLNLSTLSSGALDNQSAFYLRMTYATGQTGGSQAFDNIQLTGVSAVPEPSTFAMMGLGLGALVLRLRRNRSHVS